MDGPPRSRRRSVLRALGLTPVAHRPALTWRFWIYTGSAYLIPVVVHLGLPAQDGSTLDELVWLVTLVPAFLLSLHFGLRGAFVALLVGTSLFLGVQLVTTLVHSPIDPMITVPIYIAYGVLAISVGWLSEELHEHYGYALEIQGTRKAEALGTMAAGIAHDFNNILCSVVANAEILAAELGAAEHVERSELTRIKAAAQRGAGMVRNLLGFSRTGMLDLRPLNLADLVEAQMEAVRRLVSENVEVRFRSEEALPPMLADHGAVERILISLITNARDAMPFGGHLDIAVHPARLDQERFRKTGWGDPGDYLCLSVTDTGAGMDEETVDRIFEPFFTRKEPGEGVGLGMAMVYGLMKQHRGFVDVSSSPGKGTRVRAYFPVAKDRVAPIRPDPSPELPVRGSETILLVEDDEHLLAAAARILERLGYRVILARDGEEALQIYRERSAEVDLVLTDVMLPKRTGPELYEAIRTGPGDPRVLFMSGYPARTVRARSQMDPTIPFLQKPWTVDELGAAVRSALTGGAGSGDHPSQ